ncbi:MAG: PIN domain-containing protein [Promethearchaeota archaeon]|nr:MAG: PIN domain-containing protein [Candidatus Lokiarchaeota archaeon]
MKIYLETSVINFLFAEDAPEKMKITEEFFNIIDEYEVFISDIVLLEIEQATEQKKELLLNVIKKFKIKALESSEQIEKLAEIYVNEGIIPKKYINDALHIAIATKYKMDAIISWNLTHIVKFKTKLQVKKINEKLNEKDVIICTPEEMVY